MDPLTMMFLGSTALQGVGSLMGANATRETSERNSLFNFLNQQRDETGRREAIDLARQFRNDSLQGTTDGLGNRTRFIPGQGWVTELTPENRALQDAQLREQSLRLSKDMPQLRRQQDTNEQTRIRDMGTARRLEDEFASVRRESPEHLRGLIFDRARMGINEGFDDAASAAMRSAVRTNNPRLAAATAAELGNRQARALERASLDADIQSRDRSESNYASRRGNLAQLYAAFADRGTKLPQVAYEPTAMPSGNVQQLLAGQSGANNAAITAASLRPRALAFETPDLGMANALTSIGGQVGGQANRMDSNQRFMQALERGFLRNRTYNN